VSLAGLGWPRCFLLLCFMRDGHGDVKLCAAIGAWIGPSQMLTALVMTGIAGGLIALCWACRRIYGELFRGTGDLIFGLKKRGLRAHPELFSVTLDAQDALRSGDRHRNALFFFSR